MSEPSLCLSLFDVSGIQSYVFGANRLKENVGASFLVGEALDAWLRAACKEALEGEVAWRAVGDAPAPLRLAAEPGLAAELVYAAGGNAALLFRSHEQAVQTVRAWSRKVLRDAPGLRVAVAHRPFAPGELAQAWQGALADLAAAKAGPPPAPPLEGISLTRICRSTGLAAAGWETPEADADTDPRSPEATRRARRCLSPVAAKRLEAAPRATARLRSEFAPALAGRFDFTEDFERLGQRQEEQQVAVVHADGNGLGARFDRARIGADDDEVARRVRAFAQSIHAAAHGALLETLRAAADAYDRWREQGLAAQPAGDRLLYLPIRPILYGGDDLTFVCHGRLGLALAGRYLRAFAATPASDGLPLSACAGVAIVHSRAPFSRAYDLADALCREAKRAARERGKPDESWLDAHLALEGPGESLDQARRRRRALSADGAEHRLDWRPWRVLPTRGDDRDWADVVERLRCARQWPASARRSLMDSLAAGPAASEAALSHLASRGRTLPEPRTLGLNAGWASRGQGERATPLYDPLELADYFWEVGE